MIRQVREHIADALLPLGVQVSAYPPLSVVPPCALLVAGRPYVTPATLSAVTVRLDVQLMVSTIGGSPAAGRLDDLIDAAVPLILGAGATLATAQVDAPEVAEEGLLTVTIPIAVTWE